MQERFPSGEYEDVIGLCKVANFSEIEEQDFSLNSGRYVGVVIEEDGMTEEEFSEEMISLNNDLENLSDKASRLSKSISSNIKNLFADA